MFIRAAASAAAIGLVLGFSAISPASALSSKECGAKWQAAKGANATGGLSYNDFRKAQCGADASPTLTPAAATTPAAAAPAAAAPAAPANPLKPAPAATAAKPAATPAAAPAAAPSAANAVFPKAIDPKYAKESAGKQREHTCLDQYNANKASGGNGGLNWIMKGGGYYSECNKRLKGA